MTKKKLRPPTPFSGKREDLRKFLQEIKIFLLGNADAYPSDLDKILFVLSYMSEGDANSWKEEFFDSAEQISAQAGTTLTLGTYKNFIAEIEKDFSPYDAPKDAIYEMKELKLGKTSIEEHVSKFEMLVIKSKLAKNDAVAEYFRETLPIQLQTKQVGYTAPEQFHTDAERHQQDTREPRNSQHKQQEDGQQRTSKVLFWSQPERPERDGRRCDDHPGKRRYHEERALLWMHFGCKEPGHISRNCPKKNQGHTPPPPPPQKKWKGKELHAHIKALVAQMEDDDANTFFEEAAKEGF